MYNLKEFLFDIKEATICNKCQEDEYLIFDNQETDEFDDIPL